MAGLQITGADKLAVLSKALKQVGDETLQKELSSALDGAAKPMGDAVRSHVAQYLPSGYAPIMARDLVVRSATATRGKSVGLNLTGYAKGVTRRRHIRVIDKGTLRHPVYGNREAWVDQKRGVKPGFWSKPMEGAAEDVRREIVESLDAIAKRLARKL